MIPQFQILPPLSPTESVPLYGQDITDVGFSDIFKAEKGAANTTEPVMDGIAPNLLQVTILAMPPVSGPSAGQHAVLSETSADLLSAVSADQMQSSSLVAIPATGTGATKPDSPESDAGGIGMATGTPKLTQIQPQTWHGTPSPAVIAKATADPNQPMQTTAPVEELGTAQDLPPIAARAQLASEMPQVLPDPQKSMALAVTAPMSGAKITAQTGPSSRQLATISRAIVEPETVAPTEATVQDTVQNVPDHPDKTGDTTASVDPNLPDITGSDLQPTDANQTKATLIPPSPAIPAQLAPSTTPQLPNAAPEAVAAMIIAHAAQPESAPVEVVLNPQELGHLRFQIHHDGDQVKVILTVERPDTLDLIRRHTDQLLGDLKQAGFADATLSFGQWQQSHSGANRQAPPPLQDQAAPPLPHSVFSPTPAWPNRTDLGGQGLNLRL